MSEMAHSITEMAAAIRAGDDPAAVLRIAVADAFRRGVESAAKRADEWYENDESYTPGDAIRSDVIVSEEVRNQDARSGT